MWMSTILAGNESTSLQNFGPERLILQQVSRQLKRSILVDIRKQMQTIKLIQR